MPPRHCKRCNYRLTRAEVNRGTGLCSVCHANRDQSREPSNIASKDAQGNVDLGAKDFRWDSSGERC